MVRLAVNVSEELKQELELVSSKTNLPMNSLVIMALGWLTTNFSKDPQSIFSNFLPQGPIGAISSNGSKTYEQALDELDADPSMKDAADDLRDYRSDDLTKRGWDSYTRHGDFSTRYPAASKKLWP